MRLTPPPEHLLRCLRADSARVAELGRADRSAPVPSCPGWTVDDLLDHLAHVYLHKVEAIRANARPDPWPPPGLADRDPLDLYEQARAALIETLVGRGPAAPAWTWWPDDQTTGFWYRRMAHETAVHRVDAELARDAVTPIDADLALDGIDEVLRLFLGGPLDEPEAGEEPPAGTDTVRVVSGGHAWVVTTDPTGVEVSAANGGAGADAEIAGEAEDVLLWLWGRRGDEAARVTGDPGTISRFRERLGRVTR